MTYSAPVHDAAAVSWVGDDPYLAPAHDAAAVSWFDATRLFRLPLRVQSCPSGVFDLPLRFRVGTVGAANLPLQVRSGPAGVGGLAVRVLSCPSGPFHLPFRVRVGEPGQTEFPVKVTVLPSAIVNGTTPVSVGGFNPSPAPGYGNQVAAVWRPVVTLAGEEVPTVVGEVRVEIEEDAARVAEFSLRLQPGILLALTNWVGQAVTVDFAAVDPAGNVIYPMRLFTGVVAIPSIDMSTGIVSLTCTDDLQGVIGAMTNDQIDTLVGGRWSPHVFDPARSFGLQRAMDRMSTVQGSLTLDAWRSPRVTPWRAAGAALVLTDDHYDDGSLAVEFAARGDLINRVNIEFTYRYQRLNASSSPVSYNVLADAGMSFYEFALRALDGEFRFMTKSAAAGAFGSAGGNPDTVGYFEAPESGPIYDPNGGGNYFIWLANPDICLGYQGNIRTPYGYYIDEQHQITVHAPKSIEAVGVRAQSMQHALEAVSQDLDDWQERAMLSNNGAGKALVPVDSIPTEGGRDATCTPETDRAAANAAMETLIDIAKVQIVGSHRRNSISLTVPLNPALDLGIPVHVDTAKVHAEGVTSNVVHTMSTDTGRAVTEFVLAVSAVGGTGIDHPDTETIAPDEPEKESAIVTTSSSTSFGFQKSGEGNVSISVDGIQDADQEDQVITVETTYNAGLTEDLFTLIS